MTAWAICDPTAPRIIARLAGPACSGGVVMTPAAPALAAALLANRNGRSRRPSCHAGLAVSPKSTAV